jgi:beta-lactamase regulating signal transducer with metallopeptidase domain
MNPAFFTESPMIENLGWTLVHSVWQIAFIAFVLLLLMRILTNFSPNLRYAVSVFAIIFAFVLPVITFYQLNAESLGDVFLDRYKTEYSARHRSSVAGRIEKDSVIPQSGIDTVSTENSGIFAQIAGWGGSVASHFPTILPFAVATWLLGIALYSLRLLGGIWRLHEYKTREVSPPERGVLERFDVICKKLRIRSAVKILRSNLVETPIVVGWLKPLIIIPASVLLHIDPRGLETIIAHELIHIRRHDALANIAQSVVEILFFYHPGIWWISSQIRREREFAADAAVLELFEDSHVVYAKALADLEDIRRLTNQRTPLVATAANGGNLMQRIQRILQNNTEIRGTNSAWPAGLAFLLISAVLTTIFSFSSFVPVNGQSRSRDRKVAIGFVSIPPLDRSENPPQDSDATARLMIAKLTQYKIPAIGFVQGGMISDGEKLFPVRANIVRLWRDAGFEIGIGGFKHINFHATSYDDYVANVEKNERVTRQILAEKDLPLRYFSYPYLYTSKSGDEHKRFEGWLKDRGITSVKYGIDNNEWMYSFAYDVARRDNDLNTMKEIRDAFMEYMTQIFTHYEAYSREMFGRDIPQTMVLTPSRLVADTADDLFGMIQKRGYSFVSMGEAMSDEAYKGDEHYDGDKGVSWFERWTLVAGKRLRTEPEIDPNVQKIWEAKQSKK